MIINHSVIEGKFSCKSRKVMEYLVFDCHLPLLSLDGVSYYFKDTDELRECIRKMPLLLKLLVLLEK